METVEADIENSAHPIDWAMLKALYLQGESPQTLAAQFKVSMMVLYKRIQRGNWFKAKTLALNKPGKLDLTQKADALRSRATLVLAEDMEQIASLKSTTPHAAYERQRKLEPWVRNAKVICGWNDNSANTLVNVNVLSQSLIAENDLPLSNTPLPTNVQAELGEGRSGGVSTSEVVPEVKSVL